MSSVTRSTPILEAINRAADLPAVTTHVPVALAERLVELAGGERPPEGSPGRWIFPDGFWTWSTDEALRYALEVLPDVVDAGTDEGRGAIWMCLAAGLFVGRGDG